MTNQSTSKPKPESRVEPEVASLKRAGEIVDPPLSESTIRRMIKAGYLDLVDISPGRRGVRLRQLRQHLGV